VPKRQRRGIGKIKEIEKRSDFGLQLALVASHIIDTKCLECGR